MRKPTTLNIAWATIMRKELLSALDITDSVEEVNDMATVDDSRQRYDSDLYDIQFFLSS